MKEANVLISLSFKDINDPRYKAIGELVTHSSLWEDYNLVHLGVYDSRNELEEALEAITPLMKDEDYE